MRSNCTRCSDTLRRANRYRLNTINLCMRYQGMCMHFRPAPLVEAIRDNTKQGLDDFNLCLSAGPEMYDLYFHGASEWR
jgi:hypothetical protein